MYPEPKGSGFFLWFCEMNIFLQTSANVIETRFSGMGEKEMICIDSCRKFWKARI